MNALINLEQSLAQLDPRIVGTYVFETVDSIPSGVQPFAIIHEDEGTTIVVDQEDAAGAELPATVPFARISLGAFTSLNAVGITATIAQTLASRDIPCNVIAGYHHDHLFVPVSRAAEAMRLLAGLSSQAEGWLGR